MGPQKLDVGVTLPLVWPCATCPRETQGRPMARFAGWGLSDNQGRENARVSRVGRYGTVRRFDSGWVASFIGRNGWGRRAAVTGTRGDAIVFYARSPGPL